MKRLATDIQYYSFYRAVQVIYRTEGLDDRQIGRLRPADEPIRFQVASGLGFPSSDLTELRQPSSPSGNRNKKWELEVNFLGLHGVDSPLPSYFLEEIAQSLPEDAVQKYFLDFFNHRLLSILYRIWTKYRYYVRFLPDAKDEMSSYIYSTFGLFDPELRKTTQQEKADQKIDSMQNVERLDEIKWSKLLAYSGLLSSRNRSPEMISGVISHNFDFSLQEINVCVDSFVLRRVEIADGQRWKLGSKNSHLAEDAVVGSSVKDRSGKFRIVISNLTFSRFQDFLPCGSDYTVLKQLVTFMLRDQFAFDLRLIISASKPVPPLSLEKATTSRLGWSSFLGKPIEGVSQSVTLQVRV